MDEFDEDETLCDSPDGFKSRIVGVWAKDKLRVLEAYLDLFTTGMKRKWPSLVYIDLFSGPGKGFIRQHVKKLTALP